MARIRRYDTWPAFFVPDEGEVVLAARSKAGPFLRAAVTKVRRASKDRIRVDFQWLESCEHTVSGSGAYAGEKGNVYIRADDPVPLLRRLPSHTSPADTGDRAA